jgi:hypothetical protein
VFSNQARRLLTVLSLLLVFTRADAADGPVRPTWSKHFAKVTDPDIRQTLRAYQKQGWLSVFLEKGRHLSGKELIRSAQATRSELVKTIARDEAYLHRAGVSYATSRASQSDCQTALRGVLAVVCDERRRSSELSAIEGLLELLPAYSAQLPAPPKSSRYGLVDGKEVARVEVTVGTASRAPRQIDVLDTSKSVQAQVGDTLIVHLAIGDSTVASGVSITPAFDVLELPTGKLRGATRRYFPALAAKTGTATLQFFGPLVQDVTPTASEKGGASDNWAGYVVPGGPFGFISGSWSVPSVFSDKSGQSAHWIGIGGEGSDSLIQIGTESDYSDGTLGIGGGESYYAWYELVPQTTCSFIITWECSTTLGEKVFPGDQMFASITSVDPPLPGSKAPWRLVLQDLAPDNSWTSTTTLSFEAVKLATAEWILEAPQDCNLLSCSLQPLPNFPGMTFDSFNGKLQLVGSDSATAINPGFTTNQAVKMNAPPDRVATPSAPDLDRDGFTVNLGPDAGLPPPPLLLTYSLPNAAVGSAYSYNFETSGAIFEVPVVWALPAENLPPGMQFANGVISGTPQGAGTYIITLKASEAANYSAVMIQSVSLTVLAAWPGPPDFVVASPPAIGLAGGGNTGGGAPKPCSGEALLSVTPTNGFSGSVQLSVPADAPYRAVTFTPNPVQIGEVATSTTTMSIRYEQCPAVSVNLDLTATSGSISHSFIIPVKPPPPTCGAKGLPPCR